MDIQLWVVIAIVAAAIFFFTRRIFLQLKGKKQSGCEKCGTGEVMKGSS